jgi:hypothetical protein
MDTALQTKLASIKNRTTAYEIIGRPAQGELRPMLIGYARRHSMRGLIAALRSHGPKFLALTGCADRFDIKRGKYLGKGQIHLTSAAGLWIVEFSGRTQRDAYLSRREWPFVASLDSLEPLER